MGTPAEHQSKADHNLAFVQTISDEYPDWMATAAFYVAVQLIEKLLAERNVHSADHHQRKIAVLKNFPSIQKAYNGLYNASLVARYDQPSQALPLSDVRAILIDKHLDHIIKFVKSHSKS